jgi:serine phosphatase RsbU (regulator of sigma subunit)/tetratricopeptide (TPR) repeat protein
MRLFTGFIFFLLSLFNVGLAQDDPFLKKIGATKKTSFTIRDTSMLVKLNETARDSMYTNTDKGQHYAQLALGISRKIEFPQGIVASLHNLCRAKIYNNDYDSAMIYANQSLTQAKKLPEGKLLIESYEAIGNVHSYTGNSNEAVNSYLKAVKIADRTNPGDAATSYNNIGLIFKNIGNAAMAREYQDKCEKTSRKYKDSMSLAACLNNQGILSKNEKKYDEALAYYEEGLAISRKIGYNKQESDILNNASIVLFRQGKYEKGMKYFELAMEQSKNIKSYPDLAISYHNLAFNLLDLGKTEEAIVASEKAMDYAILSGSFEIIMESYVMAAQLAYDKGDNLDAYALMTYAYAYKDSMNSVVLNNQITGSEAQFQIEKKAMQDSLAEVQRVEEKARDQKLNDEKLWFSYLLLILAGIALVIVTIGAYFLLKSNRKVRAKSKIVEEQHKEISDSINYAQRIQNAMISNDDAWQSISPHSFILFKPKDVVSGDFYWAHFNEEKQLGIWVVADCTGHGVPGAFMSLLGSSFLNELIIEGGHTDPSEILGLLRQRVLSALAKNGEDHPQDGMDLGLCVWEKDTRLLHYAGANNPLWIVRRRENLTTQEFKRIIDIPELDHVLLEVPPNKMPIGHLPGAMKPFTSSTIELCLGDTLLMSTDGYADQFGGPNDKKLKSKPFKEYLLKLQKQSMDEQKELIDKHFEHWRGVNEQIDDVCVVGIRVS